MLSRDAGPRGWTHVRSSGADNPRPFFLKKSAQTGLWFVDQFVGVRPPVDPETELSATLDVSESPGLSVVPGTDSPGARGGP